MKKVGIMWHVFQEVAIIQEGVCCFEDESLLNEFIQMKREEFPDCNIKVYYEFWITTYCSWAYEKDIKSYSEEDDEIFHSKPKGDC